MKIRVIVRPNKRKDLHPDIAGFATVIIEESFVVNNLVLFQKSYGIEVCYPINKKKKEIFHPIKKELHNQIKEKVLEKFYKYVY